MATDATGSPTSLGIPKFNTAVDSPSGLGSNAQMDSIDTLITADRVRLTALEGAPPPASVPVGCVLPYGGASAPSGYILADGTSYTTAAQAGLFAIFGYAFGGSGGNFNVPDMRQRVPVGQHSSGTFTTLGATGGAETIALSEANLAAHTHGAGSYAATNHDHGGGSHTHSQHPNTMYNIGGVGFGGSADWNTAAGTQTGGPSTTVIVAQAPATTGTSGSAGSGTAHSNLQPYIVLNYIIKT